MNKAKGSLSYTQQIYLLKFFSPPLTTSKRSGSNTIYLAKFLSSPPVTTSKRLGSNTNYLVNFLKFPTIYHKYAAWVEHYLFY